MSFRPIRALAGQSFDYVRATMLRLEPYPIIGYSGQLTIRIMSSYIHQFLCLKTM